jgi:hypothetical protein
MVGPRRQWLPPSDVVWFTWLFLLFYLGYTFSQENEKQNLRVNFTSDQNLEETRNKKWLFLTTTERTTSGQSNFVGTRTEEIITVTKRNRQQRMSVFVSRTITLPNLWKNVTGCVARKAISGTTKYALVRKVRGSSFMVDDTDQNCTTNWWKFYWRKFSFDQLQGVF